jgi:single-strand DNA-binding protein
VSGYQKIIVVGHIGHDPSTKYLPSGDAVTEFSVAVSGYEDETEWFKAKAFGKNAENIDKYFNKGDMILVEGKMQTSSWEGKEGAKKYKTELIVDRWAFCGGEKKEKPKHDPNKDYIPPDGSDDLPF